MVAIAASHSALTRSAIPGGVGIQPQWARVAIVTVHADAGAVANYVLSPSATGVAALGRGFIPWNQIALDTVAVVHIAPGDINGDGIVNNTDLSVFVQVLLATDTDANHVSRSDINHDGLPDGADIQPYAAFFNGP